MYVNCTSADLQHHMLVPCLRNYGLNPVQPEEKNSRKAVPTVAGQVQFGIVSDRSGDVWLGRLLIRNYMLVLDERYLLPPID